MNERALNLQQWCLTSPIIEALQRHNFTMVSGDASFRRYFRIAGIGSHDEKLSYIAVDAPVEYEDSQQFIVIAQLFDELDVCCPKVLDSDLSQGFMLLSDLGDKQLLDFLKPTRLDELYALAFDELLKIQKCDCTQHSVSDFLPDYDEQKLSDEMALFKDWFVEDLLDITLTKVELDLITRTQSEIISRVLQQKKVIVHRDFHSRNLMLTENDHAQLAVIDFQDAVIGPISYDAVSLLKDCYIELSEQTRVSLLKTYYKKLIEYELLKSNANFQDFYQEFELMGLQRHLKILGIFSRLSLRDGKHNYLHDLPLTFLYIEKALANFPEFSEFSQLFLSRIKDKFEKLCLDNGWGHP